MATSFRPPPSKSYDLDITVVSAKHLKNVNWRNGGELKPYVIFWVDPDRRLATKSDDSGSSKPVWNERFSLPINVPIQDALLTVEVFHSKPSETPKPLVGTLQMELADLLGSDESTRVRTFELRRPSGRPHGKIRLKLFLQERPDPNYQINPPPSYYYSTAPPLPRPSSRDYRDYSSFSYTSHPTMIPQPMTAGAPPPPPPPQSQPPPPASFSPPPPPPPHSYQYNAYSDPYSSYYGYYSPQPQPPPPRPFLERQQSSYSGPGPSAPVDYPPHDQKRGAKIGMGIGYGVGEVGGAFGGLTIDEERVPEKPGTNMAAKESYASNRVDYM